MCRNGSVQGIKKIISGLNEAKLDPQVGMYTMRTTMRRFVDGIDIQKRV